MMRSFPLWRRLAAAILAFAGIVLGQYAAADPLASDWAPAKHSAVRLVADPGSRGELRLGVQFRLDPGWKTYWRSPGDAGFPAALDWTGSSNAIFGEINWPAPRRFSLQGFETFGYEDQLVLLVPARADAAGQPVHIQLAVNYLVCREVCLPSQAALRLDIPPGTAVRVWKSLLDQWQALAPTTAGAGITVRSLTASTDGVLDLTLDATPALIHPDVMVEGLDIGVPPAPQQSVDVDGHTILHLVPPGTPDLAKLVGHPATVTITDLPRAVTAELTVTLPPPALPAPGLGIPILLTALLGGFILNFMPCVLPVLSIKVLAVIAKADSVAWHWRAGFLATAAGVISAFLILATLLVLGKEAGLAIGWGIQFQQPLFLAALALLTAGFAANLFGLFEISLPGVVTSGISARSPVGQGQLSLRGSFLTGVFATILATPCSAPFLGTAVGFGLAGSATDIFAIFTCLGLGLAIPYLALAAMPWLGAYLPRPGHWMVSLRRLLGIPLLATSIWLVTVILAEIGPRAIPPAGIWQPFDMARITREVASGHVVFVDVTADWCLTCHVNESVVLDKFPVRNRLSHAGVVAMRADWTRPDPRIDRFLQRYHRFGIPLYVVFGPGARQGEALPEIVTPGIAMAALDRANIVANR